MVLDMQREMLARSRSFPYSLPAELDARRFEAVVSVIVDELSVDGCVPHHLHTQVKLGKAGMSSGKPLLCSPVPRAAHGTRI